MVAALDLCSGDMTVMEFQDELHDFEEADDFDEEAEPSPEEDQAGTPRFATQSIAMAAIAAGKTGEKVVSQLSLVVEGGTRYRKQKVLILIVALIVLSANFLFVILEPAPSSNPLGADYSYEEVEALDRRILFLANESDQDWHNVTITLNNAYLFTLPTVRKESRMDLRPHEDFVYFFHVPREWGRDEWELLTDPKERPGRLAPANLDVSQMLVQAREGRWNTTLRP